MKKSLIVNIQTKLILNKKVVWLKEKAKCFTAKTFRLKSPTAMGLIWKSSLKRLTLKIPMATTG